MTLSTAGGRLLSRLGPLTIPGFAFFWSARTISLIGDYAFRVAFITYIISTTHRSATALAVANAVLLVPALVFYLFGGVVGDRVRSRRRVMIVSDVGRCAVAAAIVACISAHAPLAVIIVCAVSISVGDGFFMPAAFACLPEIVPAGRLTSANSAISLSQQAGLIIGPALGGLLIGFGGPAVAFGFDAASFLASAALVAAIRGVAAEPAGGAPAPVQEPAQGVRGLFRDIYGGMQYVRMQQWLLISLAIGTVANAVFAGNLDVTVPLIVSPQGTGGARALGAFYALEGIGAVLGAVIMARIVVNRVGSLMFAMLTLMAGSLAMVGVFSRAVPTFLMAVSYGIGLHFFNSLYMTLVQQKVPVSLMSRVSSLLFLAFNALMPLGTLLMGPLIVAMGASSTALSTGAALAVICALTAFTPSIRALAVGGHPDSEPVEDLSGYRAS